MPGPAGCTLHVTTGTFVVVIGAGHVVVVQPLPALGPDGVHVTVPRGPVVSTGQVTVVYAVGSAKDSTLRLVTQSLAAAQAQMPQGVNAGSGRYLLNPMPPQKQRKRALLCRKALCAACSFTCFDGVGAIAQFLPVDLVSIYDDLVDVQD